MLFHRRFIDNVPRTRLASPIDGATLWTQLTSDTDKFGSLTWEAEPLSHTVNFLDLTMKSPITEKSKQKCSRRQ